METLCRICGSQGMYGLFGKIPRFLNTEYRDRAVWQQPICKMVSDVTGIPISKNDGLPQRICGLCISYLKHAVNFRNRAVQTRLSLVSAAFVTTKSDFEDFGLSSDNCQVPYIESMKESNMDSPETEAPPKTVINKKLQRFFDYEEKTFVEDDMAQFDGLEGIEINHPEVFRERKCGFCLHRFMLEDTYDDHLDECLFKTFLEFIQDSNYIIKLKEETALSNHEFVRRMIFAIQRVHKAIQGMNIPASTVDLLPEIRPIARYKEVTVPDPAANLTPKVLHFFKQAVTPRTPVRLPDLSQPPPAIPNLPGNPTFRPNNKQYNIPNYNWPINVPKSRTDSGRDSISVSSFKTPSPTAATDRQAQPGCKKVVCKVCHKNFLTITHLDGHMIKDHT